MITVPAFKAARRESLSPAYIWFLFYFDAYAARRMSNTKFTLRTHIHRIDEQIDGMNDRRLLERTP